jgi:ketosteroid isomerase-like protein
VLPVRVGPALIALVLVCSIAGCGASAKDDVRAKVQQFADAARHKDYRTICNQVLAPALVRHLTANHIGCEQALAFALGSVRSPTLSIGPVTVRGRTASVYTLSLAQGQQASLTVLALVDTSGGWRISSLNSPLPG